MARDCGIRAAAVTAAVNQESLPCEIHKYTNISAQGRQTRTVIGTADKKRTNFASCSGKHRRQNFRTAAIYPLLPGDRARRCRFAVNIARLPCEIHTPINMTSSQIQRMAAAQAQKKNGAAAPFPKIKGRNQSSTETATMPPAFMPLGFKPTKNSAVSATATTAPLTIEASQLWALRPKLSHTQPKPILWSKKR